VKRNWLIFIILMVSMTMVCKLRVVGQMKSSDAQNADTTKYTIENCLNEFSKDKIEKTEAGYQYWFVDKDLADGKTLKLSVVKPHSATHVAHSHPEDEFFFVLEGKVEFYLNGRTKVIGPFSSLYCPPNVEHGIRNVGDTEAKYLVVKKYEVK
jgi:quercetin dioxygenase-like cupin family protein